LLYLFLVVGMKEEILQLKGICSELVPRFGINHAKVFFELLDKKPREAKELIEETGIPREKIYSVLKELVAFGLIKQTASVPMKFFVENPKAVLKRKIIKRERELEGQLLKFERILSGKATESNAYVLDLKRTKVFGFGSKRVVEDLEELRTIRRAIDEAINRQCRVSLY